jgi:hypothetical protein
MAFLHESVKKLLVKKNDYLLNDIKDADIEQLAEKINKDKKHKINLSKDDYPFVKELLVRNSKLFQSQLPITQTTLAQNGINPKIMPQTLHKIYEEFLKETIVAYQEELDRKLGELTRHQNFQGVGLRGSR